MSKAVLALDELVDQAGDRFERALNAGERPSLEGFLEGHDSETRIALLQELLALEVESQRAAGAVPDHQDFLRRFPNERAVVEEVFRAVAEAESRSTNGAATDHSDVRISRKELDDDADRFVGRTIGRYEIRRLLGQGGMGVVLLAWHPIMERLVALKLLPEQAARNHTFMQRFRREVRTVARLSHQNIVAAHDADEAEGRHFLVMEFVEGRDLSVLVKADGPVSVAQALDFIRQAATGLDYAHKKGVTHRDVKPSNLILSEDGTVKVLDLGLARLEGLPDNEMGKTDITASGIIMGTLDYMSPEQALDAKQADPRADIYSLGCTLYFLLMGKAPYTGASPFERLLAHREAPIPSLRAARSEVPEALDQLFRKAVAKKIEDRFASMNDLIAALDRISLTDESAARTQPGSTATNRLADTAENPERENVGSRSRETSDRTLTSSATSRTAELSAASAAESDTTTSAAVVASSPQGAWPPARIVRWLATTALFVFGLIALSILLRVKTPIGTIVVEVDQPELAGAEVSVDGQSKITIKSGDQQEPIEITADEKEHSLKVVKGGFETFAEKFTVKAGKSQTIRVHLERAATGRSADIGQREAAKRLIEMGCVLHVLVGNGGELREVLGVSQLPEDSRVNRILGTDKTIYRDEHAELFAQFPDLEVFEGGVFEMSAKGVKSLAKIPKLWKIWCNESRFDDQAVEQLANLRSLTDLHLDTKNLTPTGLAHIGKLIDLRTLDLVGANFGDDTLKHLMPLRQLETLGLALTSVRGTGLRHLAETQSLKRIVLNWQKAGNEGLAAVSQFKRLEIIEVSDVTSITDAGLAHLKDMSSLRVLVLTKTSITDAGLEHLKSLLALEKLALGGTNVTDSGMKYLADLSRLRILGLSNTRVGNAGLDSLQKLPIVTLEINQTQITDDGLRSLKEFKQLDELGIGESGFTDQGLLELPSIPRLRLLRLRGTKFGQTAWENVGKLTRLEHLDINETNINDEGLAHLTGMTNLVNLELRHTDVTDQGLIQLRNLPKFREVDCSDSPGVTPAGLQALLDVLPARRDQAASPDRRIAEWVLKLGGGIAIRQNDNEQSIEKDGQLPQDNFDLVTANCDGLASVNDENVGTLRDALRLRHLHLGGTSVSDRGLEWIGNLTQLESLTLWHSQITGKTVERLLPLTRLKTLLLNAVVVGDDGFTGLANAQEMERLSLSGCRLTDASMPLLATLTKLRDLNLLGNDITAKGIEQLLPLQQLEVLGLDANKFSVGEIAAVAKLRKVRLLDLLSLPIRKTLLDPLEALNELRYLGLPGASFDDDSVASLRRLPTLRELHLSDSNIRDADLKHVAALPQLELLNLKTTGIGDEGLTVLGKTKTLRHISLNGTKVTKAGVEKLHQALPQCRIEWDGGVVEPTANVERDHAKRLLELGASIGVVVANVERRVDRLDDLPVEEFHVSNVYGGVYGKSNEALVEWNRLPHLKHLRLGQSGVSDADLRLIGECSELVELDVGECPAITDEGVAHLKPLKKLEHLDLLSTQLTDRGLEELRGLAGLRVLQISGTKITDAGMPTIGTLRELRGLHVSNTRITDAGLAKLVVLEHLESLGLHATETSDRGIDDILKFRDLTMVYLGSRVTDDGVKKLLAAPHLRKQLKGFDASGNHQITDEICGALVECQAIHGLWLEETQISDAGLKQLSGLTTLGEIWLTGSKVTAAGVQDFRKARPECGINWVPN